MKVRGAVVTQRLQVIWLEDLEHLEHGDALAVGRELPYAIALERCGDRLDPFGPVVLEVVEREVTAQRAHALRDAAAQLAAVQRADPLIGDESQGARQVGVAEPFAGPRSATPFH